jgi:hypothetical protein
MKLCTALPNCGRPAYCRGLCQTHYLQQKRGEAIRPVQPRTRARGVYPVVARVSAEARAALGPHPYTQARIVLEEWANRNPAKK